MGQVLHGSATTTEAVRRAIQHSQESLRALAKRYEINQKTVAKWQRRETVTDLPTGPKEPKSTVLSIEQEAIVAVAARACLEYCWSNATISAVAKEACVSKETTDAVFGSEIEVIGEMINSQVVRPLSVGHFLDGERPRAIRGEIDLVQ